MKECRTSYCNESNYFDNAQSLSGLPAMAEHFTKEDLRIILYTSSDIASAVEELTYPWFSESVCLSFAHDKL